MRELVGLQPGAPFVPAQLAADRDAILLPIRISASRTRPWTSSPTSARDGTRTDLLFTVREGPQVLVDHVIIVGNARTKTETIEHELQVHAGDPLGREAMFESQRRLSALGLFRRVNVTAVATATRGGAICWCRSRKPP